MKVVYSCLFLNDKNKPDTPLIKNKLEGWDYIMFTNAPDKINNTGWTAIHMELIDNHAIYTSRHYKWLGHKYLSNYTIAIYVDAYMSPAIINWDNYINKLSDNDVSKGMICKKHGHRVCIYKECEAIVHCRKDTKQNMNKVIEFLTKNNMPKNYGLFEGGIFIRHLKNEKLNKLLEELYELMLQLTYRDQALLTYILWKHNVTINAELQNNAICVSGKMGHHIYI